MVVHSEIKGQSPCKNEYKKFCLNGGEKNYLVSEDIVGSQCTRLYGRNRCENTCGGPR